MCRLINKQFSHLQYILRLQIEYNIQVLNGFHKNDDWNTKQNFVFSGMDCVILLDRPNSRLASLRVGRSPRGSRKRLRHRVRDEHDIKDCNEYIKLLLASDSYVRPLLKDLRRDTQPVTSRDRSGDTVPVAVEHDRRETEQCRVSNPGRQRSVRCVG